jgi:hypothetical protein
MGTVYAEKRVNAIKWAGMFVITGGKQAEQARFILSVPPHKSWEIA